MPCTICKQEGHNKRSCPSSPESSPKVSPKPSPKPSPKLAAVPTPLPDWYKTTEVTAKDFIACCEPIYKVLEEQNKSKTVEDPFLKAILSSYMPSFDWEVAEKARLKQKVLEMKMGNFHEELLGKLPGWETLPVGHKTGMDVRKLDDSIFLEVKNKYNTCNADGLKQVNDKLNRLRATGKRAIFVQINCPEGEVCRSYSTPDTEILNGKQIYTMVSGRETFYSDLLGTVTHVFAHYETLTSLKAALL